MKNYFRSQLLLPLLGCGILAGNSAFAADDPFNVDLTPTKQGLESADRPSPASTKAGASPVSTAVQNLNPDISFVGDFLAGNPAALSQTGDPLQRTINIREVEIDGVGYVSPYAKALVVVSFSPEGSIDIEEANMNFFELPYGLNFKLGKFLVDTDTLNPLHQHGFPFVDRPLAWHHLLDGDGLKSVGGNLSWIIPNPWDHYTLLSFTAGMNLEDANQYSSLYGGDLRSPLYNIRLSTSFDLWDSSYLTLNGSNIIAPIADGSASTIYMLDALFRYAPNPFSNAVTFLNGILWSRSNPNGTGSFSSHGFYNYLGWQFSPRWRIGARNDWVNDQTFGGLERQYVGILSFYPTETNYLRLQYARHRLAAPDTAPDLWENRVWLQVDFSLGPHQAHTAL